MTMTPEETHQITEKIMAKVLPDLRDALLNRNIKHRTVPFHNFHEAYGVCAEELHEVMDSIWKHYTKEDVAKEFLDLAVAALFAYYSFHEDLTDVLEEESKLYKQSS